MSLENSELDEFRQEITKTSYLPANHLVYREIANMPLWQREIFLWQYKQKVRAAIIARIQSIRECKPGYHNKFMIRELDCLLRDLELEEDRK